MERTIKRYPPCYVYIGENLRAGDVAVGDFYFKPASDDTKKIRAYRIYRTTEEEAKYEDIVGRGHKGAIPFKVHFVGEIHHFGHDGKLTEIIIDTELNMQFSGQSIKRPHTSSHAHDRIRDH